MERASSLSGPKLTMQLDHVMVSLEPDAHRDVAASNFLANDFGRLRTKKAESSVAGGYTSIGVAGENTLVELFHGRVAGFGELRGGLVFSFETPGSVHMARELLEKRAGVPTRYELVTRVQPDSEDQQPWYHLLAVDVGQDSPLLLLLNEVTPEYLMSAGGKLGPGGELYRHAYLNAALGGAPSADLIFEDITSVTIRLRPERAGRVAAVLAAVGYQAENVGNDYVLSGAEVTLRLVTDSRKPEGVLELGIALTRAPKQPAAHRFGGTSELVLHDDATALWRFTPVD